MEAMPDTVDDIIAYIKRKAKHWPPQCPNNAERLVMEIERLRNLLVETNDRESAAQMDVAMANDALIEKSKEIEQINELRKALAVDLEGANDELIEKSKTLELLLHLRPIADYIESEGDVLWWRVPIDEPPWVGTPQCAGYSVELHTKDRPEPRMVMRGQVGGWPGDEYFTHWTPLPRPRLP
jgi:hypothetical protein